jgi:hypothetical protein
LFNKIKAIGRIAVSKLREAAENFLDSYLALVNSGDCGNWDPETEAEVIALRQALAEPEQEPVAWAPIETAPKDGTMILICLPRMGKLVARARYNTLHNFWVTDYEGEGGITQPYYFHKGDLWHPIPSLTTPPQRQWVGLTNKEFNEIERAEFDRFDFATAIEAKLKEKNT